MSHALAPIEQSPSRAAAATPAAAPGQATQAFQFTGSGGEYFRIWIVNLLLSVLTLGVYSAWAKVRRTQYFYRNTRLAGSTFFYHGKPLAILKGRLLALALALAFKLTLGLSGIAAMAILALPVLALPWLLGRSFRFRLANSSYRGVRMRFAGTGAQAYQALGWGPPVLLIGTVFIGMSASTLGTVFVIVSSVGLAALAAALVPLTHFGLKDYQHNHSYFGQMPFFTYLRRRDFLNIYARALGLLLLGSLTAGAFGYLTRPLARALGGGPLGWLIELAFGMLSASAFYLLVRPFLEAQVQNLTWNGTELGSHTFISQASARKLCMLHATNLALITLTLGLYKPFATIRLLKYRIESVQLDMEGDFEDFLAEHVGENPGAMGQEAGELFDLEIAL